MIAFFKQTNLVSPFGRRDGCLHAGRTTADDADGFLFRCRRNDVLLYAYAGICGAGEALDGIQSEARNASPERAAVLFVKTVEALDARPYFVLSAGSGLLGPFGIGDERSCHGHGIGFSFRNDSFRHVWIGNAAHDDDWNLYSGLLHGFGHRDIRSRRHESGGEHFGPGPQNTA